MRAPAFIRISKVRFLANDTRRTERGDERDGSRCARFISDTFASKVAACQDKYADACVGNVTGSNAVNVFLGIGVAWSIAAIYHACHNQTFYVQPGK